LKVTGSEGYKKAEVTGGGVPLEELNVSSMEAKGLPGLYLCGEICDVFGRIGGFNFYWAWVSGRLAGIGAALNGDTAAVGKSLRQQKDIWVNWQEEW
jgi:predicted flavoprotein YhiN